MYEPFFFFFDLLYYDYYTLHRYVLMLKNNKIQLWFGRSFSPWASSMGSKRETRSATLQTNEKFKNLPPKVPIKHNFSIFYLTFSDDRSSHFGCVHGYNKKKNTSWIAT
jgi:hypothetical protein